jgi:hypothetical protein
MSFLEQIKQKQNLRETPTRESDKKRKQNKSEFQKLLESSPIFSREQQNRKEEEGEVSDSDDDEWFEFEGGADPMFRKYLKYKLKYLDLLNNEE